MDGHRHHHGNEEDDDDDDDDDEDDEGDGRDKKKNSVVHQHQQIVDKQSRFSLWIFTDIELWIQTLSSFASSGKRGIHLCFGHLFFTSIKMLPSLPKENRIRSINYRGLK